MKKYISLALLMFCCTYSAAQNENRALTDSLSGKLNKVKENTSKVMLLGELATAYVAQPGAESIAYAQEELKLSVKLGYHAGEAMAYSHLGAAYLSHKNDSAGVASLTKAIQLFDQSSDKTGEARCYSQLGQLKINQCDPAGAVQNYLAALKLLEKTNDQKAVAYCINSIGSINKGQRNYTAAMSNHLMALKIFKSLNDQRGIGNTYNSIGDVCENQGDYPHALENYRASLKTLQEAGHRRDMTWPYYNIGEVFMLQHDYDRALTNFLEALKLQQEFADSSGIAWSYNNIGSVYLRQGQYTDAERYCVASLGISSRIQEVSGIKNANDNLYQIYEASGDYKKALAHHKALTDEQNAIFNSETARKLAMMQMRYDYDKKDAAAKTRQRQKDILIAGIAGLLLLVSGLVLNAYRTQKNGNKLKGELLKQKEATISQKEVLMKEVYHRIKNNLQVISTLLDLQLENMDSDRARAAIKGSTTRLRAISLIHEQLYEEEQVTSVEFAQFTTDLHNQISTVFIQPNQHIDLHNGIPAMTLDIDTATPLGLILNELMTNSYKHAFKGEKGYIILTIEKKKGMYELRYTDSGPGLPENFENRTFESMGLMLLQSLSKQIGGSFSYISATKTVVVTFRDAADMKKDA